MNRSIAILVCAVLLTAISLQGCKSRDKETLWGTYQEPVKPAELPKATGAAEIKVLWKKSIGAGAENGFAIIKPAYGSGGLYVANRKGDVYKLDPDNGSTLWRRSIKSEVFSGVGADSSIVVVALDKGNIVALSTEDGEKVWEATINRQISAIPAIGKGRVIVRTADGLMIGIKADSGDTAWSLERTVPGLSVHGDSTPVISGDAVLAGLANGKLIANNVVNGREYWETEVSFAKGRNELERLTDSDSSPLVEANTVYTATYQGNVAALQLQNAAIKWKTKLSSRLPMSLSSGRLLVTSELGDVVAINADTGDILWTQEIFRGRGMSRPLGVGERVVVGDAAGNLHALDASSGKLLETRKVVKGAVTALIDGTDQIAVFSSEGDIAVLSILKTLD